MNRRHEPDSVLQTIDVASPCTANWADMQGDERVRHCGQCHMNVYNLSEMKSGEIEQLLLAREGRVCIRFFRRYDGTVVTQDCSVGLRALKRRLWRSVAAACAIVLFLVFTPLLAMSGKMRQRMFPKGSPLRTMSQWSSPPPITPQPLPSEPLDVVMGDYAAPLPPQPAQPSQPFFSSNQQESGR